MPADELDGFPGDQVGQVALPLDRLAIPVEGRLTGVLAMVKIIDRAADRAKPIIEAVAGGKELWLVAQVPLAADAGGISCRFEHASDGGFRSRQAQFTTGPQTNGIVVSAHVADTESALEPADTLLIPPRQQGRARRRAFRGVGIERREAHALGGNPVDTRRADVLAAVTSHIAIAEVIGHDQHDIRAAGSGRTDALTRTNPHRARQQPSGISDEPTPGDRLRHNQAPSHSHAMDKNRFFRHVSRL